MVKGKKAGDTELSTRIENPESRQTTKLLKCDGLDCNQQPQKDLKKSWKKWPWVQPKSRLYRDIKVLKHQHTDYIVDVMFSGIATTLDVLCKNIQASRELFRLKKKDRGCIYLFSFILTYKGLRLCLFWIKTKITNLR